MCSSDLPPTRADVDRPESRTWYPFQLGFILLNLAGLTNLHHADRAHAVERLAPEEEPVERDDLVARARAAAAIELARRAADLGVAPPTPEASPAPVSATSLTRAEMIARARAVAAART